MPFDSPTAWDVKNLSAISGNYDGFQGTGFDGRYIYYVPYYNGGNSGWLVRYDTEKSYFENSSYEAFNLAGLNGGLVRFSNSFVFDGRFVYLTSHHNGSAYDGHTVRYDTSQPFSSSSSYETFNLASINSAYQGYAGGTFDGRYVYYFPNNNDVYHGNLLRFDTTKDNAAFNLYYSHSPNNHGGSVPASTGFRINTDVNSFGVYSNHDLEAGVWHHVVTTYDGNSLNLYIDGNLDKTIAAEGFCLIQM